MSLSAIKNLPRKVAQRAKAYAFRAINAVKNDDLPQEAITRKGPLFPAIGEPDKTVKLASGHEIGIIGPSNVRYLVIGEPTVPKPWNKMGARPIILQPALNNSSIAHDASFSLTIDNDEPGHTFVFIQVQSYKGSIHYLAIQMPPNVLVSLKDLNISLPEGSGLVWAGILPKGTSEIHYSQAIHFSTQSDSHAKVNYEVIVTPRHTKYSDYKKLFYKNIDQLSYEENLALRFQEIKDRRNVLLSVPPGMQVLLGRRCNSNCIMCSEGRNPDMSSIPEAMYEELPRVLPFVRRLVLVGGEPLIYNDLHTILAEAANHPQLTVGIATNGSRLLDGWLDLILNTQVDLKLSIDAVCAETYEYIRRGLKWEKLVNALEEIKKKRKGKHPLIGFSFCTMRKNYKEILEFVNFSYRMGAKFVYYNLMMPGQLEPDYKNEYLLDDENACREVAYLIRTAKEYAMKLDLGFNEKVLGWILPKYPNLVIEEQESLLFPKSMRRKILDTIIANQKEYDKYWEKCGGPPQLPDLPCQRERVVFNCNDSTIDKGAKIPDIHNAMPDGFFCMAPFDTLNINTENTFVCCHANFPYNNITYGSVNGLFDVWNHPLMQRARRELYDGDHNRIVCHPRCPYFRNGGSK